ncbi:hypothetical protein [Streptomyces sp. NPDC005209]|uniref:hypothetical protein n=1 Tax=Streptomyces sp. NPDC005209 TaxID=3156715 RepID=UPI0033AFA27A
MDTADIGPLERHLEEELTRELGRPAPRASERLPALDQVRRANLRTITDLAADLAILVKAARRPLPPTLAGAEPDAEVMARLEAAGALDFRPLAAADVVAWLAVLGQWPAGMPPTTDLDRHGLTESDLDRVRNAAEHARHERERRRRSISVGGRAFDVYDGEPP